MNSAVLIGNATHGLERIFTELDKYQIGNILNKNLFIRNLALTKNIGKYSMYNQPMLPEVGMAYNVYERLLNRPTDIGTINGLVGYNNSIIDDDSLVSGGGNSVNKRFREGKPVDLKGNPVSVPGEEVYVTNSESALIRGGDVALKEAMDKLHNHIANKKYVTKVTTTGGRTLVIDKTKLLDAETERLITSSDEGFYSADISNKGTTDDGKVNKTVYVTNSFSFTVEGGPTLEADAKKKLNNTVGKPSYSNNINILPGTVDSFPKNENENKKVGLLGFYSQIRDGAVSGSVQTNKVTTRFRDFTRDDGRNSTLYITNPSNGNHATIQGGNPSLLSGVTANAIAQQKQSNISKRIDFKGTPDAIEKAEYTAGSGFVRENPGGTGDGFVEAKSTYNTATTVTLYSVNSESPIKSGNATTLKDVIAERDKATSKNYHNKKDYNVNVGAHVKPQTVNGLLGYNNGITHDKDTSGGTETSRFRDKVSTRGTIGDKSGHTISDVTVYVTNTGSKRGSEETLKSTTNTVHSYLNKSDYVEGSAAESIDQPLKNIKVYGSTLMPADYDVAEYDSEDEAILSMYREWGTDAETFKNTLFESQEVNLPNSTYLDAIPVIAITHNENTTKRTYNEGAMGRTSLLSKTNALFNSKKINSIIGRFYAKEGEGDDVKFLSRGRNLLKKGSKPGGEGYDNPYCRVWTMHHQYSKMPNLIRPRMNDKEFATIEEIQGKYGPGLRPYDGAKRLSDMSVLQSSGFVNITPKADEGKLDEDSVKRCMFSIENLAWKDIQHDEYIRKKKTTDDWVGEIGPTLTKEQIGPNGGRIMWFPPYNLRFSEDVTTQWNDNTFIGRGEKIYTYVNTERGGSLSFTLLIDHPSIVNTWKNAKEHLDTYENEKEILRFFAGCDDLDLGNKPQELEDVKDEEIEEAYQKVKEEQEPKSIKAFVFFPNNYSGKDDPARPVGDLNIDFGFDSYLFDGSGDLNKAYSTAGYEMYWNGYEEGQPPVVNCVIGHEKIRWYYRVDEDRKDEKLNYFATRPSDTYPYGDWNKWYKTSAGQQVEITGATEEKYANNGDTRGFCLNDFMDGNMSYGALTANTLANIKEEMVEAGLITNQDVFNKTFFSFRALWKTLSGTNGISRDAGQGTAIVYENLPLFRLINTEPEKIESIKIYGYASSHGDQENNNSLSRSRAESVKNWIAIRRPQLADKIEVVDSRTIGISSTNMDVSSLEAKIARCATVEIFYYENTEEEKRSEEQIKREIKKDLFWKKNEKIIATSTTYDDEYAYFRKVKATESFIRKRITQKVQFFDPAFHSITPEGFNARLTFLQQCTRQGPTVSASDGNSSSKNTGVGNLSFGRAPYCVLRIGDFYNTKILIENIQISYDNNNGVQWDLNPEGVGVQPMMADVTIRFKFIGGSDISGPIERLQNAVSYNYYSNASIYDRRADHRESFYDINQNSTTDNPVIYYEAMLENKGGGNNDKK